MIIEKLIKKYISKAVKARHPASTEPPFFLSKDLDQNLKNFEKVLENCADIRYRQFKFAKNTAECCLIYIDGMSDSALIADNIVKPLMMTSENKIPEGSVTTQYLMEKILFSECVKMNNDVSSLFASLMSGDTILILDGDDRALILNSKGYEKRGVEEPQTEQVVRGPREGFNEDLITNTSLIRRKLKNTDLKLEIMSIGRKSSTKVCIAYVNGIVDPRLINLVKKRLQRLEIDSVADTGILEEFLEDAPFSVLPTIGYTEKPDVVVSKILEGRVAIISDGSPFALTMPYLFIENFQTAGDYYMRPLFASLIRLLRLFTYLMSIYLVPIFIAFTTFHQELIPDTLLVTIARARENTPFPAFIEGLILVISFEILKEAGLRLPRPVGQAISIVGALIMGDAAVAAGLVGAPMVIAVAISAVSNFATPEQAESISFLRIANMVSAAMFGGFGIALSFIALLIHIASLKSYGTPYLGPIVFSDNVQDSFVRFPLWMMEKRPKGIAVGDTTRIVGFVPPDPKTATENEEDEY